MAWHGSFAEIDYTIKCSVDEIKENLGKLTLSISATVSHSTFTLKAS